MRPAACSRQQRQRLVAGLADVHDERQADAARQLDLGDEGAPLGVARREVAVEVEAALADGDHARVARPAPRARPAARRPSGGLVRMQTDGRVHARRTRWRELDGRAASWAGRCRW